MGEYSRHPAALVPPPYTPARFRALVAGTAEKGQQYPVELYAGTKLVLRGWHMLLACRAFGVEPRTVEVAGPSYPEVRTDTQVEDYTAAESAGRDYSPIEKALWTLEVVLEAFTRRAQARRANDPAALADGERGNAVDRACDVTGANNRYVKVLKKIADEAPALYATVRAAVLSGDLSMNVNRAQKMFEDGLDGETGEWHESEPGEPPRPPSVIDPIPNELFERIDAVKRQLGVSTRGQAIEQLLKFRDEEPEAWRRFLGRWREEREREARL